MNSAFDFFSTKTSKKNYIGFVVMCLRISVTKDTTPYNAKYVTTNPLHKSSALLKAESDMYPIVITPLPTITVSIFFLGKINSIFTNSPC